MEPHEAELDRPARHPILDRLENADYGDFNGQSLDYEPNLEFDDTDLKQEIEEELEQMNINANLLLNFRHPDANEMADANALGDHHNPEGLQDELLDELSSQLYQDQNGSGGRSPAYLESPHDLLEENFEEAFKSSLFELDEANSADFAGPKQRHRFKLAKAGAHRLLAGRNRRSSGSSGSSQSNAGGHPHNQTHQPGKLNAFFSKATSGFYSSSNSKQRPNSQSNEPLEADTDQGRPFGPFSGQYDSSYDLENLYDYDDDEDFSDIAQHNCVEVAGDDLFGRKIITIYACRLPSETKIHHLRLLKYIMFTLDQYVENDYCVVYFHYGLNSQNKPKLNFLYQAYKAFDRKYKKNLKALFLVHPTNFIRIVWQLFKPVIR